MTQEMALIRATVQWWRQLMGTPYKALIMFGSDDIPTFYEVESKEESEKLERRILEELEAMPENERQVTVFLNWNYGLKEGILSWSVDPEGIDGCFFPVKNYIDTKRRCNGGTEEGAGI